MFLILPFTVTLPPFERLEGVTVTPETVMSAANALGAGTSKKHNISDNNIAAKVEIRLRFTMKLSLQLQI